MTLRRAFLILALALLTAGCGSSGGANHAPVSIGASLQGPKGVQATVFARGLGHVSAFALDGRGRLWVASSGATTHTTDAVYVVSTAGAKPVKVIAKTRGPLGLQWVGSDLYVSSLDGVTRYSGLTGDSFAHSKLILRGPVQGAENNNIVLAPSGRLVMGVSANCDHCATTPKYSGAIISFDKNGGDLQIVARRVRAAYGLVYDHGVLYATLNQRDDLGTKTPGDWLAIVRPGQDWGFPACYGQGGSVCKGVPAPVATLDAHAGAGGVAIAGDTAVVSEWNLGRVVSVSLGKNRGATSTLVSGIAHPLPVLAVSGGALLIGDWGSGIVYRITGAGGS